MSNRVTYVMVRIDETVEDPSKTVQNMLREAGEGVQHYQQKSITVDDEEQIGGPVIYFP